MDSVAKCYEALSEYCKAREVLGIDSAEFEITEIRKIAKAAKEKRAAELLPFGATQAAERIGNLPRHIYRLANRWKKRMSKNQKIGHK